MDSYKVVVLGDSSVGKTSITTRFIHGVFYEEIKRTVLADCMSKRVEIKGKKCTLHVWDTAGEERYRAVAPNYYKGADGAIVVFDVTDRTSFASMQGWISELNEKGDRNCSVVVVGNKIDRGEERTVSEEEANSFASSRDVWYLETSA